MSDLPKNIVNISNKRLSQHEKSLLEKGLNFCPVISHVSEGEIKIELDKFHKTLRTKTFFHKTENENASGQLLSGIDKNQPLITEGWGNKVVQNEKTRGTFGKPYQNKELMMQLRESSTWVPPHGPKNLEDFIAINEMEVSNLLLTHKPAKKNLTKEESQA